MFERIRDFIASLSKDERAYLRRMTTNYELVDLIDMISADEAKDDKASVYDND